jgi:hypothetical protein
MGRGSVRRGILFGAPALMAMSSVLHPLAPFMGPGVLEFLRPRLGLWMGVHVVQLFLVLLLGLAVWFLSEGLSGRAATVSRLATAFFLVFYAAFDSVVGIGTGLLARLVDGVPGLDPTAASELVDRYWRARVSPPVGPLIGVAQLSWVVAVIAAALALRSHRAPRAVVVLLFVAAIAFGIDHPVPTGTVGMLAFFVANVLLYRNGMLTSEQRRALG